MWLTLNDEVIQEENGALCFDASRAPSVPLDPSAVSCLVTALTFAADVPVRTWVLAFQVRNCNSVLYITVVFPLCTCISINLFRIYCTY